MLLAVILCFSTLPMTAFAQEAVQAAAVVAEQEEQQEADSAEEQEEQQEEAEAAAAPGAETPADKSIPAGDESISDNNAGTQDTGAGDEKKAAVQKVQALIDALPETVTEDNAESVSAQLEAIAEAMESLTEEQIAELDMEHLYAISEAMSAPMTVAEQHTHCICGKEHHDIGDHKADSQVTFTKLWMDNDTLKMGDTELTATTITDKNSIRQGKMCYVLPADNYYLGTDIELGYPIYIASNGTSSACPYSMDVKLCLNGNTLTANGDFDAIICSSYLSKTTFTLTDCQQTAGMITHAAGKTGSSVLLYSQWVESNGNGTRFNMYGGSLTHNTAERGGGVNIVANGDGGIFNLYGGVISDNEANDAGGGVYIDGRNSTFTMYGGEITKNTAGTDGGGVSAAFAKTVMNGGSITGNTAAKGGGASVGCHSSAYFYMNGGEIKNNKASENGGGVYVYWSYSYLHLSGEVNINGNTSTDSKADNVYLSKDTTIIIDNNLATDSLIGVTTEKIPQNGDFAKVAVGTTNYSLTESDRQCFTPDAGGQYVIEKLGDHVILKNSKDTTLHHHPICGKTCSHGKGDSIEHTDVYWEGVSTLNDRMPAGYYYLTRDVTLNTSWMPQGDIVLDLNGHNITMNGEGCVINQKYYGTFTLTDCKGDADKYGKVTHGNNIKGGGIYNTSSISNSNFVMYGGSITGNTGHGVFLKYEQSFNKSFTMYGGEITGNTTTSGGGVYVECGNTFTMKGGIITGNKAKQNGGGVYVAVNDNKWKTPGVFNVSGDAQITRNYKTDDTTADNVYLQSDTNGRHACINVDGALSGNASIGVSAGTIDVSSYKIVAQGSNYTLTNDELKRFNSDVADYIPKLVDNSIAFTNGTLHEHKICGKTDCNEGHGNEVWKCITNLNEITGDGSYYLKDSVTLDKTWTCNYNVKLCLNGKTITGPDGYTTISIASGHSLDITDCQKNGAITHKSGKKGIGIYIQGTGTLWNGAVTGNNDTSAVSVNNGGSFRMYGGSITGNKGENSGGVFTEGTFEMTGGKISNNSGKMGGGVYVAQNGTFTMTGGDITGNSNGSSNAGGGVYVANGGKFNLAGEGRVTDNKNTYAFGGGGVYVATNGAFTMDGGDIANNVNGSDASAGGVCVARNGTFTMNSGNISSNENTDDDNNNNSCGGVYIYSGIFTMNDGKITGNTSKSNGGGVHICASYDSKQQKSIPGQLIMNGGSITGNKSESGGGGVYVSPESIFTMTAGKIEGNTSAKYGGGVYVVGSSTVEMRGGEITGNNSTTSDAVCAGGVYVAPTGNFIVSGTVRIQENYKNGTLKDDVYVPGANSEKGNLYLEGNGIESGDDAFATITIATGLMADSRIDVNKSSYYLPTTNQNILIATGADDSSLDYTNIFGLDVADQDYTIGQKGSKLYLMAHQHSWVYKANGAVITAECSGCDAEGGSVTIEAPTDRVYDGGEHEASVTASTDWQGPAVDKSAVSYESEENGKFASCDTPRNSGTYRAKITVGDVTAMVEYDIKKADLIVDDFTFGSPSFREYGWGTNGYHEAKIRYAGSAEIGDITVKYYDENGKKVDRVKNAGVYTVKIDVAESKNFNAVQDLTCNYWTFVIYPAILTVTPTAGQSKTYGDPDPEVFTYKISGTKFDDKPVLTGTLGRAEGKDAGTYAITLGTLALKDGANFLAKNYKLVLDETTVNFTIDPKILHSTDLKPLGSTVTKVYDGTTKVNELNVVVDPTALENGDTQFKVEGTAVYNSANIAEANSVIFTPKPITEGNYHLAATEQLEVSGTLPVAITPATITVTPNSGQTKTYGEEDNLTYTYSGEISGETPLFTGALGRADGNDVGNYVINKGTLALMDNSDGDFRADNYTLKISDTPVDFVITKATPVITVEEKTLVKNGVAVDISTWASFDNTDANANLIYELADAYEGITLEGNKLAAVNADTTAKSFVMTVTAGETKNFTAPEEKRFTVKVVEKEDAEVKIDAPTTKTYGDADFTLKATTKAADNGIWSWTSSNEAILKIVSGANTAEPTIHVVKADATGATLTATYISDAYYGTASVKITVAPKNVTGAMIGVIDSKEYNGGAIQPTPEVKDGETILAPGGDFKFSYSDNTKAGTATVTITGIGNYTGIAEKKFTIEPKNIAGAVIELEQSELPYNGSTQTVKIQSVTVGGRTLTSGDYSIINGSNMFMSANDSIPLRIEGRGNYTGTAATTWKITKIDPVLDNFVVTPDLSAVQTYDGNPKAVTVQTKDVIGMGAVKVYYEGIDGTSYTRSETAPTNAGTYKVILNVAEGTNYKATSDISVNFVIAKATPEIKVEDKTLVKNGNAVDISTWASFNNTDAGAKLTYKLVDAPAGISLTEDNRLRAENAATTAESFKIKVTADATENFTAPEEKQFTVQVVEKADAGVVIDAPTSKTYGDADFTLQASTVAADNGTWSWTSSNESILKIVSGAETAAPVIRVVKADATGATLTATYISDAYYGMASVTITVNPKTVTAAMIGEMESREYTGSAIMPTPEVKDGEAILTPGGDFEFGYSDNTNAGTATLTITGKGNYTGIAEKKFTIEPKNIESAIIVLGGLNRPYTGEEQTVEIVSVTLPDGDGVNLERDIDYTVKDNSNTATDVAKIVLTIEGMGNYTGTAEKTWAITKAAPELGNFDVTPNLSQKQIYNGNQQKVTAVHKNGVNGMGEVKVYYEGTSGTAYTRSETAPTNAGSYKVILTVAEGTNYTAAEIEAGTLTIEKTTFEVEDVTEFFEYTKTGAQTIDLAELVPGATNYALGTAAGDIGVLSEAITIDETAGLMKFTLSALTKDNVDNKVTVPVTITSENYEDVTVNVIIYISPEYRIIDGANSSWTQNTDGTVVIRGDGEFNRFHAVKVDGKVINRTNYEAKEGSTIITLKAEYLKTLSTGSHTFAIVWNNGIAGTNFTVAANTSGNNSGNNSNNNDSNHGSDNSGNNDSGNTAGAAANTAAASAQELDKVPATGDPFGIWLTLFAISLTGLAGMLARRKKN